MASRSSPTRTATVASPPAHWRNIFDRLADPATFTGVYAERFRSGPGINHDSESKLNQHRSKYNGSTNLGTDEVIRDIRYITRPHFNRDRSDATSPFGRATEKVRSRYEAAERALLNHLIVATGTGPSVYVMNASGVAPLGSSASSVGDGPDHVLSPGGGRAGATAEGAHNMVHVDPEKPIDANIQLQLLFQYYCRFGRTGGAGEDAESLDSFNFAKFVKDCPDLVDARAGLTPAEVDLIFVRCKNKAERRITYGQWLDALAAMADVRYREVEEASSAFALLLTNHVFCNPACVGIAQAVRSGLIRVEAAPRGAGGEAGGSTQKQQARSAGVSSPAGPFTALAQSAGLGSRQRTRSITNAGSPRAPASAFAQGAVSVQGVAQVTPNRPASSSSSTVAGGGHLTSPSGSAAHTGTGVQAGGAALGMSALGSTTGSMASPGLLHGAPEDLYAAIARKALEIQMQANAANGGTVAPIPVDPAAVAAAAAAMGLPLPASSSSSSSSPSAGPSGTVSGHALPHAGGTHSPASTGPRRRSRGRSLGALTDDQSVASGPAVHIAGAVVRTSEPTFRAVSDTSHPDHPVTAGLTSVGSGTVGGGIHQVAASVFSGTSRGRRQSSGAALGSSTVAGGDLEGAGTVSSGRGRSGSRGARSASRGRDSKDRAKSPGSTVSRSPGRSTYGEANFKPALAGEGIKPGSVFDRLTDPEGFTGVYKRAWFTDGRINQAADVGASTHQSDFKGHTNHNSNETIHNIKDLLRPNLSSPGAAGERPAFRP